MKNRAGIAVVLFLLTILPSVHAATELQLSQQTLGDLAPPYRLRTSVASNGRGYVVAWEATADSQSAVTSIYIRALGADGVPLRPYPTLLGLGREPHVVWNGHEYLAVWGITSGLRGPLPSPSVVGMRLREDGSLIDTNPVTIVSESNPFSSQTTLDWNGSQYLVTWNRGIALVDADLQHVKIIGSVGGTPFYAAANPVGSFIVLSSVYESTGYSLYLIPFSSSGGLGVVKQLTGYRGNVVPFEDGYVLIWDDQTNLHYGLLSAEGRIESSLIVGPGGLGFPRLATRDFRLVASWESFSDDTHTRVCTVRFETIFQPVCSAISAGLQHDPSIGTASTSILVAWSDRESTRDSVRVLRSPISQAPHVEAGLGRNISDASSTPAAERRSDGSLAVAWSEYNQSTRHTEIHLGGKSSQGGRLSDRAVFADDLDQTSPVIAAGLGRTMALWEEGPAESPKIRMTIFNDATKSLIATLPLAAGSAPSVAFDGKEWLATWQSSGVIRFALINSDGSVLASGAMPAETLNSSVQAAPAVAWSGKSFFVTWRETVAPGAGVVAGERIEVATVNTAGVASASRTLDATSAGLAAPSIAANGSHLLVSWGTPSGTLRQLLFDDAGKQLSAFIDFAWPYAVSRTRTHAMPIGFAMFAVFAGSRIALTSYDGRAVDAFDVPEIAAGGDFAGDPDGRFDVVYSRSAGTPTIATFAQTVGSPRGLPRRRAAGR
jgi:hypothetical protein